jgi:hypothetical protein
MFLRLNGHSSHSELEKINQFIAKLVEYAAVDKRVSFEQEPFRLAYPQDSRWLLNHPTFIKAMDTIYLLKAKQRKDALIAIRHDCQFYEHTLHGRDYYFEYPQLHEKTQNAVGELYKFFYSQFSGGIRLSFIDGGVLDRATYKKHYWATNPIMLKICPVCLNKSRAELEQEVEHYFPKGARFFPMLMLHPYNLYFACATCNQKYKGETIPLANTQDNLLTTYLPFHTAPENELAFLFSRNAKGDCIKIVPSNPKASYMNEKIQNLNRLFHLEERWTWDLEGYATALISKYTEKYTSDEYASFKVDFENQVKDWEKSINTNREVTIQSAYYRWLLQAKSDSIFKSIQKKP